MKTFPTLDWQSVTRFSQVFSIDIDTAKEIITYLYDNDVVPKYVNDIYSIEGESEDYKRGFNDAIEEMEYSLPSYKFLK